MTLYEELQKCISAYNPTDGSKAFLSHMKVKEYSREIIKFNLQVNQVTIYFQVIVLSGATSEEIAKHIAAANILTYLVKSRLPIWEESLNGFKKV